MQQTRSAACADPRRRSAPGGRRRDHRNESPAPAVGAPTYCSLMSYEVPTVPSTCPPPRRVEVWTTVPGHNVGKSRAFCECGHQAPRDYGGTASEWRVQHLAEAWPVLVPRQPNESVGHWMDRTSDEYVAASQLETKLLERDGHGRGLQPGEKIPTISSDYAAAMDRVAVLEHQLEDIRS